MDSAVPVFNDSRKKTLSLLSVFLKDKEGDFRRLRGAARIGKSSLVSIAYREVVGEKRDVNPYLSDSMYREFSLPMVLDFFERHGGAAVKNAMHGARGRFRVNALAKGLNREYASCETVIVRFSIRSVRDSHERVMRLLLDEVSISFKIILEERSDAGYIKYDGEKLMGKPMVRNDIFIKGFEEPEARKFVNEVLVDKLGDISREACGLLEAGLVRFCGGHPELLVSLCAWLADDVGMDELCCLDEHGVDGLLWRTVEKHEKTIRKVVEDIVCCFPESAMAELFAVLGGYASLKVYRQEFMNAGLVVGGGSELALLVGYCYGKNRRTARAVRAEKKSAMPSAVALLGKIWQTLRESPSVELDRLERERSRFETIMRMIVQGEDVFQEKCRENLTSVASITSPMARFEELKKFFSMVDKGD